MLYLVHIATGNKLYMTLEEYKELKQAMDYLGIKVTAELIEEKMYRIQWFDYIDEEWSDLWCTNEENYMVTIEEVREAEVEYRVKIYN